MSLDNWNGWKDDFEKWQAEQVGRYEELHQRELDPDSNMGRVWLALQLPDDMLLTLLRKLVITPLAVNETMPGWPMTLLYEVADRMGKE